MTLLQCFIISVALHSLLFLLYPTLNNRNNFIPEDGIIAVEILSKQSSPSYTASHGESLSQKKSQRSSQNIQNIGKEGNTQKIEGGNIKVIYPKESIKREEEGMVLLEVKKKARGESKITILKASLYDRLNKAAIAAIENTISRMEVSNISQKIQIRFKLKRAEK